MTTGKDINIKDNILPVPVWGGSVAESASRLVRAIYMVTSLFSENEPLKGHLKMKALDMLSLVVSFMKDESQKANVRVRTEEIMSLIETAKFAGILSDMNHDILMSEFSRFLELLKAQSSQRHENTTSHVSNLLRDPIELPKTEVIALPERSTVSKGHSDKGHVKKNVLYKPRTSNKSEKPKIQKTDNTERKQHILDILKDKGETTIKDIAAGIVGCSEKTVQRDLLDLLNRGAVKKRGERRWTMYSLV